MRSNIRVLFLGDIYAGPGREAVKRLLPSLKDERKIDFAVVNGENLAGGSGITSSTVNEMFAAGVDCITSGNHVWRQKEAFVLLEEDRRLIRPFNYPPGTPGRGWSVFTVRGKKVAVVNLLGRIFMDPVDCPFRAADAALAEIGEETKIILCDIHAEATSEKIALSWYLDGRVSAVIGTHTHVQTSDERILPGGTSAITDAGMTGSHDSVIGVEKDIIIRRFLTGLPERFVQGKEDIWISGVIVEIDALSGTAVGIERIQERGVDRNGYFIKR